VFWRFANSTVESQEDGEERTVRSLRLLFTRGYSVFNAAQVDGYGIIIRIHTMDGLFKNASAPVRTKLMAPFVGSSLLGVGLIWFGVAYHWEFVKGLGEAFAIAGIVGLCIELFAASQIIEHASHQMAARMAGQWLPKAAGDLLYKLVHDTKFVYREYRKTYRIVRQPAGTVIIHLTLSYRVVNNGKRRERYKPKLLEEGMYSPRVTSLQYGKQSVPTRDLNEETLVGGVRSYCPKKRVGISPSEANAAIENLRDDQVCLVQWAYQIEMREHYSDVTAFGGMTVNPVLELVDKPEDLDFWASEDNSCKQVGRTWTYEQAFVGGQHVRAWWRPKP
jgi:hypothetical protein